MPQYPLASSSDSKKQLTDTATSLSLLIREFLTTLNDPNARQEEPTQQSPPPLDLLHTSATLLKAQTTKLSLLLINKPFTPSAIRSVLGEVAGSSVPALLSAVQTCTPQRFGKVLSDEVKSRVRRVLAELDRLIGEVLEKTSQEKSENIKEASDEQTIREEIGRLDLSEANAKPSRDSIASTGVVWEACDSLIDLRQNGIAGLLLLKARQYREMLEDAIIELKEWREDAEDEGFEEGNLHTATANSNTASSGPQEDVDRYLGAPNSLPADREDLKQTLDQALKKLRLVSTLYQAIGKRRLRSFPSLDALLSQESGTNTLSRIDELLQALKQIPSCADELAGAFYELDDFAAQDELSKVCRKAKRAADISKMGWNGSEEDEYTSWLKKWEEALDSG
ncbi:MAG: hypothetical protein M1831_000820 [Alyxoria varia]|nr:MAG: hypothetical protein M1831_000820 [Alyxoria varia]